MSHRLDWMDLRLFPTLPTMYVLLSTQQQVEKIILDFLPNCWLIWVDGFNRDVLGRLLHHSWVHWLWIGDRHGQIPVCDFHVCDSPISAFECCGRILSWCDFFSQPWVRIRSSYAWSFDRATCQPRLSTQLIEGKSFQQTPSTRGATASATILGLKFWPFQACNFFFL